MVDPPRLGSFGSFIPNPYIHDGSPPSTSLKKPLVRYLNVVLKAILFFSFASIAIAQAINPVFNHLTIDDGLSQNSVNCIHQDRFGFMWFGTQDGLNRYDGYEFKIYRHESGNANSLGNNYVWTIHEDAEGIFWIGSFGGGLTRFDPSTETFAVFKHEKGNFRSLSNNHIFSIIEYPEGTLWLCTDDGLNKFDKKSGLSTRYLNTPENIEGLPTNHLDAVAIQKPDYLWLSTNNGLVRFGIASGTAEYFTSDPVSKTIPLGYVQHLSMSENKLRIVCAAGLVECDFGTSTRSIVIDRKNIAEETLTMRRILYDARGYIWMSTSNGLLLSDGRNNTPSYITHEADNEHSLSHNNVLSLYQSREGIIWIGTRDGLNKVDRVKENFQTLKRRAHLKNTLSHKTVSPVVEDSRGILWLGTLDGVNAYEKERDAFTVFKHDPRNANSIGSSYILSLCEDRKGNLWVGTRGGGISRLAFPSGDLTKSSIKTFSGDGKDGLLSKTIHCIREDSKGTLWVGTAGRGLAKFISEKEGFKHYERAADGSGPSHSFVYCVLEDSFGNMWIGTPTGGLNLFDRETEHFIYIRNSPDNPNSLSNNIVLSIHEDAKHSLWVGTAGGLNKMVLPLRPNLFRYFQDSVDVSVDSLFAGYGRKEGFPNEVIYGILEDGSGNLWLSTNRGLAVFDPGKSTVIKTFDASDGIQNNEFNQNGYFRNAKGEMYFAGIDGVSMFHPDSIRGNLYIPPVVFTDFRLFNKSVPLSTLSDEKEFVLQKAIHQTERLTLSYDHDVLSFDFAALNFINPEKNQYAYMMEGFDNGWITAGTKRSVTYTNLDPGEYILRVKASNNDGVWNEQGAAISLTVPPPPWLRWYAYVLYTAAFLSAVVLVIRDRVRSATRELETKTRIERAKVEERETVRKQSSADFHDEAGHKLTKISLFTELARGEATNNPSLKEYLSRIEEQTKELSSGMRDFIWVLDPTKETLFDTIHRLENFGNSMFGYSEIEFSVKAAHSGVNGVVLSMENRRALVLIFKEAMNNCLKYSKAKHVEMVCTLRDGRLEILLRDDGVGFDPDETSDGYGLRTMKDRARKIGAELEVASGPSKGATVCLRVNIPHMGN